MRSETILALCVMGIGVGLMLHLFGHWIGG